MKLIVGLGNPGEKYKNTRHNIGWLVMDRLKFDPSAGGRSTKSETNSKFKIQKKLQSKILELPDLILIKPQTFMNKSGVAVKKIKKKHPKLKNEDIFVIHDDLDIKLGEYKIDLGKGPKVHNGLASIYEQLGTKDFWHIRIGIDNRIKTNFKGTGEEYVLGKWLGEEKKVMGRVIGKIKEELNVLI